MRRLLLFMLLVTAAALAQQGNTVTIRFAGAPTGTCSPISYAINNATGDFYDCLAGSWLKVGVSGGGGGTPGAPVNSVQFNSASAFAGDASFLFTPNTNLALQQTTAATAASAIALGAGATNKNSAVSAAGAATLAMPLNINVGDFVIIFTDTTDTAVTLSDDGTGGGNTYLRLGSVGTFFGQEIMWYVPLATVSATTVTVADAATAFTISGATYVNVKSAGAVLSPVAHGSNNSLTLSLTTTAANSLVVGNYNFNKATTFTATSGSVVSSSFNNTNTVNTSLMSITTTTAGSYILSATTNMGTPVWQGLALELQASTGTSHSSPLLTLGGTGWNGSASVNELTTLQAVVPNVTSPVPILTATPVFGVVNNGIFTNAINGPYLSSTINGISASAEFTALGQAGPQTSAVFGGVSIPAASTQFSVHGIYGGVNSSSTTSYAVGGYFQARGLADSTKIFGLNANATDGGFAASQLFGAEFDIFKNDADAANPKANSQGVRIVSGGAKRPAAGIYIAASQATGNPLSGITIDMANSGDTATNRMIYLIPPDNLNTTVAFQLRNHTDAANVLTMTDAGAISPTFYQSLTNCAATGTSASPSVASCAAAPAGSFSCAVAASAATCQVNTTAVTAASQIFITQRSDTTTGTRLSVTCNTGLSTVLPEITAVTAGASFTINLGTISVNPECFSYFIVN